MSGNGCGLHRTRSHLDPSSSESITTIPQASSKLEGFGWSYQLHVIASADAEKKKAHQFNLVLVLVGRRRGRQSTNHKNCVILRKTHALLPSTHYLSVTRAIIIGSQTKKKLEFQHMRAVRARLLISLGFGVGVTKVPSRFTVMDVGPSLTRRGVSSDALMHHDKVRLSWLSSECRGSQCRLFWAPRTQPRVSLADQCGLCRPTLMR